MQVLSFVVPRTRRTVRELVLVSAGVAFILRQVVYGDDASNIAMYAMATLALAVRFFAGRVLVVGTAFAALAQRWPGALEQGHLDLDWTGYLPFGVIAMCLSKDLAERFEGAPSAWRGVANPWATLPASDRRRLIACGYAMGSIAAILVFSTGKPTSFDELTLVHAATGALWLCLALLGLGRAAALLAVPPLALTTAGAALFWSSSPVPRASAVTVAFLAVLASVLAAPYMVRLIRRVCVRVRAER